MRARLERYVRGRAARPRARGGKRDSLGMRPSAGRSRAASDDLSGADENASD